MEPEEGASDGGGTPRPRGGGAARLAALVPPQLLGGRPLREMFRGAGPAALLPMLLSLVALLFAFSASRQVSLAATGAGSRDLARALRQRLVAMSAGKKSVTLDLDAIDALFQQGAGGEALLEDAELLGSTLASGAPAEAGGEGGASLAAAAADPPGLVVERASELQWQGDGGEGEGEEDEAGGEPEMPLLEPSPAGAPPAPLGGPKPPPPPPKPRASRRPRRGLTRADLVRRQLLRADALVPRNRPDEPPRRRPRAPGGRKCDPEERFLHLLTAREGMSAWMHTLQEAIAAANALGRTFVEPCVAGGLLLPCTPGRVLPVPEGPKDTDYPITALDDPLAVPAFAEHCGEPPPPEENGGGGGGGAAGAGLPHDYGVPVNITSAAGRAYPLSLYLDVSSVRALAHSWVSFEDWTYCTFIDEDTGREELTDVRRSRGLVHAEHAYCVSAGDGPLALSGQKDGSCVTAVGPYRFRRVWWPTGLMELRRAGNTTREHMATGYLPVLRADGRRDMFFYNVWRGFWRKYGSFGPTGGPKFNAIHVAAIRAWLAHRLDVGGALDFGPRPTGRGGRAAPPPKGGKAAVAAAAAAEALRAKNPLGSYAVFQWRSETVDKDLMEPCSRVLAGKAKGALAALRAKTRVGGVLAADLPAPNNPCAQWHVYEGSASENGARRKALATLGGAGLAKYDEDHPGIDAGVLSIRDWLLAVHARWYVTCHSRDPSDCRMCFRSNSKYVGRILDARAALGKPTVRNWFQLASDGLVNEAKQTPDPAPPPGKGGKKR